MSELAPNLAAILAELTPAAERLAAARRRRRRLARTAAVAGAVAALLSGAAIAAVNLLSVPPQVRRDLQAVDRGMPADLRLNPDVEHARRVAISGQSAVYFARLAGGGYCAELVTQGRARGAVCSTSQQTDSSPLGVTIPYTDPVTDASPVTVSGHVGLAQATQVKLVYPDGGQDTVGISPERFYVADVPTAHLAAVHRGGLMLLALDQRGHSLAQAVVPADAITPPSEAARPHDPIELDTVSDERDLTLVLAVRGTVYASGSATVKLTYPSGSEVSAPVRGQSFAIPIPPKRQREFAREAGVVSVLDAQGRQIAKRAVASVAYWRARNGG